MEYVLTENGNIKVTNGQPTFLVDGKETTIDAIAVHGSLKEAISVRDDLKKENKKLSKLASEFEGIDPVAAKKALQDIATIGKDHQAALDHQREEINKVWSAKEAEWTERESKLSSGLRTATVERDFFASDAVKNLTIPPDIAYTTFGKQFADDGTAKDKNGNPIYSTQNPGQLATGEEAIKLVLSGYEKINEITKAGVGGGGSTGDGGTGGAVKQIPKSEFDSMTPKAKMDFSKSGGKVV